MTDFPTDIAAAFGRSAALAELLDIVRRHEANGLSQRAAYDALEAMWVAAGCQAADGETPTCGLPGELMDRVWGHCPANRAIWETALGADTPAGRRRLPPAGNTLGRLTPAARRHRVIMTLTIPDPSLVVLVGPSGAGKTTFAAAHFRPTEVVSSDACRGMVADDPVDQTATDDAFAVLHTIAARRLARNRLTVVDATNVRPDARAPLLALAKRFHFLAVAVVLDLPEAVCHDRNRLRPDRNFGPHVVRGQAAGLRKSLGGLRSEGFSRVFVLDSPDAVAAAAVERVPLWTDRRHDAGPFDIVGDVHGCLDELEELLRRLGYERRTVPPPGPGWGDVGYAHPAGRKAVFLGDLVDRGPRSLDVVRLVRNMVDGGSALCVPGNHDVRLARKLLGRDVAVSHGLAGTLAEVDAVPADVRGPFADALARFLDDMVSHLVLDGGRLVVAHAGLPEDMHGRASKRVRDFALYGDSIGTAADGLPIRRDWAADYRGPAAVVYGHTPVADPEWVNGTANVDTGCVFGGRLTAVRWPEREFVAVPAGRRYCPPGRPFQGAKPTTGQQAADSLLSLDDVAGRRKVATRLHGPVVVPAENAAAALEAVSRFAVDPRWLVYVPPTMSPPDPAADPAYLEHPAEALAFYRRRGVARVVCQEKHMGSRAVAVVCRDAEAARTRFGVHDGPTGAIYTRGGRPFFADPAVEGRVLDRVRAAFAAAGLWDELATTWAVLDAELLPWSAKARDLLVNQYAAVGAAGRAAVPRAADALSLAVSRLSGPDRDHADRAAAAVRQRADNVERFTAAYRRYCWPVAGADGLQLAPFHLLATEGHVHADRPHAWHLEVISRLAAADPGFFRPTAARFADLSDPASEADVVAWWTELTAAGGEGMVVKPAEFVARGPKGLVQPAVKCRGPEYLRVIYGPDYRDEPHLGRLKRRSAGRKRALAAAEFALGIEGLERFVRREPLRRVHECGVAVLALESEPVDPRL